MGLTLNLRRMAALAGIGALSVGLVAMYERPSAAPASRQQAPMLHAFYAPPVEEVRTERLREGETLSALLARASIDGLDLTDLMLSLRERRNPRSLRPGVEVTIRRWLATGAPRAVEVRLNPDTTVRLDRNAEGWDSRMILTQTHLDTVFAAGRIDSGRTLYESIAEDDKLVLPPRERVELVSQLATVFEYQLDFSREIQPGDSYRFVYEREARPDGSARSRRILAAEVRSQGKPYTAFYFATKGASGYYDAAGKSLKRSMSRYPIDFVRITSRFSRSRYHPVLGIYRAHLGTDFGAAYGTPVKATSDGVVVSAGWEGGYGRLIVLRHGNGYSTRYGHLSRFARGLRHGKRVSQGQVIGYVGSSGMSTGPHLHYEIRDAAGRAVDLSRGKSKLPASGVLTARALREFRGVVQERLALLQQADGPRGAHVARAPDPGSGVGVHGAGE